MTRHVDPALTRQAQAWIARIEKRAVAEGRGLSDWEKDFLESLDERLEKFGSAFADPDKGQLSAPLSLMQGLKLREINKKTKAEPAAKRARSARKPDPARTRTVQPKPKKPLARTSGLKRTPMRRTPRTPAGPTESPT